MIRVAAYQCKETFIAATCGSVAIASPGNDEGRVSPASVRSESAYQSRGGSDSVNGVGVAPVISPTFADVCTNSSTSR